MFDLFVVSRTAQRRVQGQFEPRTHSDAAVPGPQPRAGERRQRTRAGSTPRLHGSAGRGDRVPRPGEPTGRPAAAAEDR
jgi:hypothetical protein